MITKRIIPCLDVKDGRVVKGVNFLGLADVSSPVKLAEYYSRCGADELVFYDITASAEGRALFTDILRQVAERVFIPLTVGGGINTVADFDPHSQAWEASYTLTRWFDDINNDFAARVDWCTAEKYEDANHAPSVSVAEGIDVTAKAGDEVTLTAQGEDPDGDTLSYRWWRYFEADTYDDGVEAPKLEDQDVGLVIDRTAALEDGVVLDSIKLEGADTEQVTFTVPEDAKSGDTIHMVVEVTDDGAHNLKHYQRVVVTVA